MVGWFFLGLFLMEFPFIIQRKIASEPKIFYFTTIFRSPTNKSIKQNPNKPKQAMNQ